MGETPLLLGPPYPPPSFSQLLLPISKHWYKNAILGIGISTISLDRYQVNLGRRDLRKKRKAGPIERFLG